MEPYPLLTASELNNAIESESLAELILPIMDTILKNLIAVVIAVGGLVGAIPSEVQPPIIQNVEISKQFSWAEIGEYRYEPTHTQVIWRSALEWCESRGINEAVNPKDKDGTPSHSNYQFKWETTRYYAGERYKLIPINLEKEDYINHSYDYELMTEVVNRMIGERDKIKWSKEFPQCVSRLGMPPK